MVPCQVVFRESFAKRRIWLLSIAIWGFSAKIRAHMAPDLHAPTLKIYREILSQLEELKDLYGDISDADGEEDDEQGAQADVLDVIIEEATERGMDEEDVARVFKAVAVISKKALES